MNRSTTRTRRIRPGVAVALASGLLLTACTAEKPDRSADGRTPAGETAGRAAPASAAAVSPSASPTAPAELPGLGPRTRATVGADTRQVVVVTGEGEDSDHSTVRLYERHATRGWVPAAAAWPARNGHKGWSKHHMMGDKRTPVGTFTLTDAGGKLPNPGTDLPYDLDRGPVYTASGLNPENKPKAGALDYVVAINYNRVPGKPPYDFTRPMGDDRGGGIWLHVSHYGGTEGCVGIPREQMKQLLRALEPGAKPMVVMGPRADLAE
ncbi:L,D-transpeptidase family protein [Streptomyces sp. NPDC088557]|uniref:L,D-transpeptidase family protein n=1 Tax=Streptomyces sp. NPDC088557 TaxID=3365867 RepID=UPI00382D92ED